MRLFFRYDQRKTFVLAFAPLLRAVAAAPAQWPQWLRKPLEDLIPVLAAHGIALRAMRDQRAAGHGGGESDYGSDADSEQSLDDHEDAGIKEKTQNILQKLDADWEDDDDEDWDADSDRCVFSALCVHRNNSHRKHAFLMNKFMI